MPCTLETARCTATPFPREVTPDCCRRKVIELVASAATLMDEAGVRWWLDYGLLLGHVRDGGFIPWDKDGDLGVLDEDLPRLLELQEAFEVRGHRFDYMEPGDGDEFSSGDYVRLQRSQKNNNTVEVFPWHLADDGLYHRRRYASCDRYKGREFPAERLLPLQRAEWEGLEVSVPADTEWFCEHRYGENWRQPLRANHDEVER